MISKTMIKKFCRDDISKIENYDKAIADDTQIWECHHRDEIRILPSGIVVLRSRKELKENGRYWKCPANELIFLTKEEHRKLHGEYPTKSTKESRFSTANQKNINKRASDFGKKYIEHYGYSESENKSQYWTERSWYLRHNKKCRWE